MSISGLFRCPRDEDVRCLANWFVIALAGRRLSEVRVCLNKDFSFRDCAEVVRGACKRDAIAMPAVRGG